MNITCITSPPFDKKLSGHIAVVVDVLRATSTVCSVLEGGAKHVRIFNDYDLAKEQKLYNPKSLICGERNAEKYPGFDRNNSPSELLSENLKGKDVVLCTTNGSSAMMETSKTADVTFVCSLLNLSAVAAEVGSMIRETGKDLTIICSGANGRIALDDLYVAGALIHKVIVEARLRGFETDDGVTLAKMIHGAFQRPMDALLSSISGKILSSLSRTSDIALCAKVDLMKVVPVVKIKDDEFIVTSYGKEDE